MNVITPPVGRAKITKWLAAVLESDAHNPKVMTWVDKSQGLFRITDQVELARLWGVAKNNKSMTYEKFRYKKIITKNKELTEH